MINFNRTKAMIYKYYLNLTHSYDRLSDMVYWPLLNLIVWGLTGLYFVQESNNPDLLYVLLAGLVFWLVIWTSQYEISVNLLQEIWEKNIVNIFVSPLTISEWIISLIIFGFIRMTISVSFSAIFAFFLYQYKVFIYGYWLIPIVISLILTGWAVGFFVAGFLIKFGQRFQTIAWAGVSLLAPLSAPYYSISILPIWAQKIAYFVPSSYIFEGMRDILQTGAFPLNKLFISFGLNILYLILSIWFFVFMFKKSRKLGLGRLI